MEIRIKLDRKILLFFLYLLPLLIVGGYIYAESSIDKFSLFKNQKIKGVSEVNKELIPTIIPQKSITDEIFEKVNTHRNELGLKELLTDKEVCDIAIRYTKIGLEKGLTSENYSDVCSTCTDVGAAQYKGFLSNTYEIKNIILNSWKNDKTTKSQIEGNYTYGCVKENLNNLVFIFANKSSQRSTETQQNTNTSNQIECIGPDGKHFNTTMDNCKKLNESWGKTVDYMTNCTFPSECGGGTKLISKSECDKPCTRVSGNTNTNSIQPGYQNNNSTKTAVFISYGGYTVYCPAGNVGAVMTINSTMESKKMEWAKNYNECSDLFTKSDSCWINCANTHDWSTCKYGTPEYKACEDEISKSYQSCISACPSISNHCDYVYAEQKSMTSQISNLCN